MANNIDKQYLELVNHILRFGYDKSDRTGTGTKSIYGWQIRHSMKEGFPLITTKKMAWKTMVTELLWFLRGDTNIKYLVDNDCHIWNGDAYMRYVKWVESPENQNNKNEIVKIPEPKEDFIKTIKGDDEIVKKMGKRYCDEFAKKWGELGPIYGAQWRSWKKYGVRGVQNGAADMGWEVESPYIDQIAEVINLLKTDPDSRRMIVNAWNVADLPMMTLPPCHMMFQFYTRLLTKKERYKIWFENNYETGMEYNENEDVDFDNDYYEKTPERAISLRWDQRSNDIGLGSPMNISSYSLLLMIIAKQVNMVPEEIIGHLGDCHIYNNHVDGLKEQLTRIPYELPTVKINDRIVNDISEYTVNDFTLENYVSHPKIYLPLSN